MFEWYCIRSPYLYLTLIKHCICYPFVQRVSCFVFLHPASFLASICSETAFVLELRCLKGRARRWSPQADWVWLIERALVEQMCFFISFAQVSLSVKAHFFEKILLFLMRPNGSKMSRNNSTPTCFYDSNRDCFKITQFKVLPTVLCGNSGGSEPLKHDNFRHLKTFETISDWINSSSSFLLTFIFSIKL